MSPTSSAPGSEDRPRRPPPTPRDEEDALLLRRTASGDRGAFETLYHRLAPSLMAFAYHLTRDRTLAEDVVQEAFLKAWKAAPRFDAARARVRTWLFQIAKHTVWNEASPWRRGQGTGGEGAVALEGADPAGGPSPSGGDAAAGSPPLRAAAAEIRVALEAALTELSDLQREAFVLVRLVGLPYAEVAEILDVPEGTVKSRMAAAEQALRARLARFL